MTLSSAKEALPIEQIVKEAAFLCDRLRDFSWDVDGSNAEDIYRNFHGHIVPPLARLEMLLSALRARGEEVGNG